MLSELKNRAFLRKTVYIMIPVILQQLISVGINFLDNVMIGPFGEYQISAVSLGNQFYNLFRFVCMGLGSGAIVMSSQYWWAKEYGKMKTVAAIAMRLTFALSLVFGVISTAAPGLVLKIYTDDPQIIESGLDYVRLIGWTYVISGLSSSATYLLRSSGHVKIPLISSIVALFLNLFFNWVFIYGKLGAPRMEATGAAVGTVIARAFEFLLIFGYFMFKDENFGFRFKHFGLRDGELWKKFISYSLPVLISDTLLGIGLSISSSVVGHMGAEVAAANAIVASADQLITIPKMGIAGAAGVIIGNTVGEGDRDRARREGSAYCAIGVLLGLCASCLYLALRRPYVSLYTVDEGTKQIALSFFTMFVFMSPLQTLSYTLSKGVLRAGGDTRFLLWADIILLWGVSLPLGSLAAFVWHLPVFWTYFLLKMEFGLKSILCLIRFLTGKWIREVNVDI